MEIWTETWKHIDFAWMLLFTVKIISGLKLANEIFYDNREILYWPIAYIYEKKKILSKYLKI